MNQALLERIESPQFRKDDAKFNVGDSVKVHTKVVEGDKERIQAFSGVVIGRRGHGLNSTFTVSPTANFASSLRNCSDSIFFCNAWFITL